MKEQTFPHSRKVLKSNPWKLLRRLLYSLRFLRLRSNRGNVLKVPTEIVTCARYVLTSSQLI